MIASLVNGIPGDQVSILDRGLQFGDGLFETLAVVNNQSCLWDAHMARLAAGCSRLGMRMPDVNLLAEESRSLIGDHQQAVLKIILTRGCSTRGYAVPADTPETRILSLFSWDGPTSQTLKINIASTRLGLNPQLAGLKHLNRLEQVMARRELPSDCQESILLDAQGRVVEGIAANLFLQQEDQLKTPLLDACGVAGVARQLIMNTARAMNMPVEEMRLQPQDLLQADGLYLSSSLMGICSVSAIQGQNWQASRLSHPVMEAASKRIFQP
ncbi:aminodeoxychorismate lyase [Thiolapillus sp.]